MRCAATSAHTWRRGIRTVAARWRWRCQCSPPCRRPWHDASVHVPVRRGDGARVPAGAVYLHNRSGVRKASGNDFTPAFAVAHWLDAASESVPDVHVVPLETLSDDDAATTFFVLRIAIGRGHVVVQAIDRAEKRFTAHLVQRPLPGAQAEIATLGARAATLAAAPREPASNRTRAVAAPADRAPLPAWRRPQSLDGRPRAAFRLDPHLRAPPAVGPDGRQRRARQRAGRHRHRAADRGAVRAKRHVPVRLRCRGPAETGARRCLAGRRRAWWRDRRGAAAQRRLRPGHRRAAARDGLRQRPRRGQHRARCPGAAAGVHRAPDAQSARVGRRRTRRSISAHGRSPRSRSTGMLGASSRST